MEITDLSGFTQLAHLRIDVAREFYDRLKEYMGEHLISAYIYGSTAKNSCHADSDVDMILIVKKPTSQERAFMNSSEGGLWAAGRNGTMNFAYNSHYLFSLQEEIKETYGIDVSPYYHYDNADRDTRISGAVFSLNEILAEATLSYPFEAARQQ